MAKSILQNNDVRNQLITMATSIVIQLHHIHQNYPEALIDLKIKKLANSAKEWYNLFSDSYMTTMEGG